MNAANNNLKPSAMEVAMDNHLPLLPGTKAKYIFLVSMDSNDNFDIADPIAAFASKFNPDIQLEFDELSEAQVAKLDQWADEAWNESDGKEDMIDIISDRMEESGDPKLVGLWDMLNWALLD